VAAREQGPDDRDNAAGRGCERAGPDDISNPKPEVGGSVKVMDADAKLVYEQPGDDDADHARTIAGNLPPARMAPITPRTPMTSVTMPRLTPPAVAWLSSRNLAGVS
jgi:hypothetical protein